MTDTKSSMLQEINGAIRDNPLAAALIGAGLLMAVFRKPRWPDANRIPETLKTTVDAARSHTDAAFSAAGEAATRAGNAASEMISQAADAAKERFASDAGDQTSTTIAAGRERISQTTEAVRQGGVDLARQLQQSLTENFEKQPLLVGAVGLAIGAGLASLLPGTEQEGALMGEHAATIRGAARERTEAVVDDIRREARAQGFTPEAARETLGRVASKAKNVASSAREAVTSRTS
jgi:hypothetical protein